MFENIKKDFINHNKDIFNIGFQAMIIYRFGRFRYRIRVKIIRKVLSLIYKLFYMKIRGKGIELPCEVEVGEGLRIDHNGGIVVSGYSKIGNNCILRNGVTIGTRSIENIEAPIIGNNVNIGSGAKILGKIKIGNNVNIGANSVVLIDVPNDSTIVGIPGKIIKKN